MNERQQSIFDAMLDAAEAGNTELLDVLAEMAEEDEPAPHDGLGDENDEKTKKAKERVRARIDEIVADRMKRDKR